MAGHLPLEEGIGVRVPDRQPARDRFSRTRRVEKLHDTIPI